MTELERFRAFADACIPELAKSMQEHDFKKNCSFFDPDLPDKFTASDFEKAISEQEEDLGCLVRHTHFGQVKGPQDRYPGCIRFVYGGEFTKAEGLIVLCVHERNGKLYLNEHVYYWD